MHNAKREGTPTGLRKPQKPIQSPDRLYKAPTEYTKLQNTIQRPEIPCKSSAKPKDIRQRPNILDKDPKYLTRVATNINLPYNI